MPQKEGERIEWRVPERCLHPGENSSVSFKADPSMHSLQSSRSQVGPRFSLSIDT